MKKLTATLLVAFSTGLLTPAASATPIRVAALAPRGTNPSTPRPNWDQCDMPSSLTGISEGVPAGDPAPQWKRAENFNVAWQHLGSVTLFPPSALVTCTLSGPFLVLTRSQTFGYSYTVTDVSDQAVYVAQVVVADHYGKSWEHAAWHRLAPGQSVTLRLTTNRNLNASTTYTPYVLVRPSVLPAHSRRYLLGYTDWMGEYPVTRVAAPTPTGSCAGLFPGTTTGVASAPAGGYWVSSSTGEVAPCGASNLNNLGAALHGSLPAPGVGFISEDDPSIVSDPTGNGYWVVNSNGEVNAYGAAHWYGQHNIECNDAECLGEELVTGAAVTPNGRGYWFVNADGKVSNYGDASFYGSAHVVNGFVPNRSERGGGAYTLTDIGIAGIAPTLGGHGYVLVARDGAVYGFGSHRGDACGPVGLSHGAYVSGVAPDYQTGGYWVAETDGRVVPCHAPSFAYKAVTGTVTGIGALGNGLGYRLVNNNGDVYDFGAATFRGNA